MIILKPDVTRWAEVEGEIVALELESSTYLGINRTGALLWPLLIQGTTSEAMTDVLVRTYKIPMAKAQTDVADFIETLGARGLLADE